MADVRIKVDPARARADVDWDKIRGTTEADIQRHMREDGETPDGAPPAALTPATVRARTGLTQAAFAQALGVPLQTWRNWEQGRTRLDPAVRSLLAVVAADHEAAFRAISERPVS